MQKTLWIILAALMFAGTASVMTTTLDSGVSTSVAAPAGGEGSYPTPPCMPGGTNCK